MTASALHRRIWRWHFYAGLFVLPFVLALSVSGAIYLFKPQIDAWEELPFRSMAVKPSASPDAQLASALAAYPGTRFVSYRLPREAGDPAMISLQGASGAITQVFVSPAGDVTGGLDPERRVSQVVARFHGSLMLGEWGDRLVELAASWTVVLILTGLWLWYPRPWRAGGMLWPRRGLTGRALLRDWHRVTGFWIAGLVLVTLASGLPWAGTWGSAFRWARSELHLMQGQQSWKVGAGGPATEHADHHAHAMAMPPHDAAGLPLSHFVAVARAEHMAFPVLVLPPHAPQAFGAPTGAVWTVKSETQNRPLARSVSYDPATGTETARSDFADKHPIDRLVNTGIAWHEGALFGIANQLIGLATALALIALSLLGVLAWLKRRPRGKLGAPPQSAHPLPRSVLAVGLVLGLLLPLFGLSVLVILAGETLAGLVNRSAARTIP